MISTIKEYIKNHQLITPGSKVVVGLSGGPDSVFLLHLLAQLRAEYNLTLIAAHLDHQWRENSSADVIFCKKVAEQLQITFTSSTIAELGKEFPINGSKEAQGRTARRYFLEKVAHEHQVNTIALGHHAQDQQETFFIRLLRGSSLSGLTGMKPKEGKYIRPLLETNKAALVDYLGGNGIAYLTDPTNDHMTYLRNRIRTKVLPSLQECDERFNVNFLETITRLQETEKFLELETEKKYLNVVENDHLKIKEFLPLHPIIQQRILIYWLIKHHLQFTPSQALFNEIIRFFKNPQGGAHTIHPTWQITKKKNIAAIKLK